MRPKTISDDDVLETTRRLLLDHGGDLPLDRIGRAVNLSGPALLKRFGTKARLLVRALVAETPGKFLAELDHGPDERPLEQQLEEIALRSAGLFETMLPRLALLRSAGLDPAKVLALVDANPTPPPIRAQRALSSWLARAHQKGLIREVPHDSAAAMILGSLQAPAFVEHLTGQRPLERSLQEHARSVAQLMASALASMPAEKKETP